MSLTPTFPGVYIQEIPSGNASITPVSTSIAAFVGRAPFGPTNQVMTCFSFADFQRYYGGLALKYPMSYAVRDFFSNGGAQAVIARLFEPTSGRGSGVAQLPFPPSPPMIPTGWMLASTTSPGVSTLQLTGPPNFESEPEEGMIFGLSSRAPYSYTVTNYTPAGKGPATISFVPPLNPPTSTSNASYPMCTALTFAEGPTPTGWSVLSTGSGNITATGGSGVPELGNTFTVPGDPTTYTITAQPTVSMSGGIMQLVFAFTPKTPSGISWPGLAPLTISLPAPQPMPVGWQISAKPTGTKSPYVISVVNGANGPLNGDTFTVGSNATVYTVAGFTPAAGNAAAQIAFTLPNGVQLPTDPSAFCFCCSLNFTQPAPQNYTISTTAKVGGTQFVLSSKGSTGVVDVGYTFMVPGDSMIYTIVIYNQTTGAASFLPEAATAFAAGAITLSPPLQLVAASPGMWGNFLTASVDTNGITPTTAMQFAQYDLGVDDLFNLTLTLSTPSGQTVTSERYLNLAVKLTGLSESYPNRLDYVLEQQSMLAQVGVMPLAPPASGSAVTGSGGNDGQGLSVPTYLGNENNQTGIYLLETTPSFNLLCIPPDQRLFPTVPLAMQDLDPLVREAAADFCTNQRAIFIADPPAIWETEVAQGEITTISPEDLGISGMNPSGIQVKRNVAVYFPRVYEEDMLLNNKVCLFPACGMVAGVIAATDVARGVWKSPAGTDATLANVTSLALNLTDAQNGVLNPLGINCLRTFPVIGPVVWGARTLMGADQLQDDYKYLSVRRLTLFIESSLYQSTQWAVFEPNDESLWSALRLSVNNFLAGLSRQGAFYNYLVTCDSTTTTSTDIANGVVNILVQIAPVKPAEFVVITIQQTMVSASS